VSWDNAEYERVLGTRRFGREVVFLEEVDSTNRWLLENEGRFYLAGATVVANHQTVGRGRRGRRWQDVAGKSLLFSVLLRPDKDSAPLGFLPLISGVAVAESICRLCACSAERLRLKWPNDILVDGCKVGGILAESVSMGERVCVVVGIGINLTQTEEELPRDTRQAISSLHLLSLQPSSRESLLAKILEELEGLYDLFRESRVDEMKRRWSSFAQSRGTAVAVETDSGVARGSYEGIGDQGQLILRDQSSVTRELYSGEILSEARNG